MALIGNKNPNAIKKATPNTAMIQDNMTLSMLHKQKPTIATSDPIAINSHCFLLKRKSLIYNPKTYIGIYLIKRSSIIPLLYNTVNTIANKQKINILAPPPPIAYPIYSNQRRYGIKKH